MSEPRCEVFTLPWPPSANTSKMPVHGRMVSTKGLRTYHTIATLTIGQLKLEPMVPPYSVHLHFEEPSRHARDLSNFEKAVIDSMVKTGLLVDDCWIDRYVFTRNRDADLKPLVRKVGRVVVTLKEMPR